MIKLRKITEYHGSIAGGRVPSSSIGLATQKDTALELKYGHHTLDLF